MHRLLFKLRIWFEDRFPTARQRRTALVLVPLSVLCAAWVLVFAVLLARRGGGGADRPAPPTPAVLHARELTEALHRDAVFAGITVAQHVDFPAKFQVRGRVRTEADLRALKMRLEELDSKAAFVVEVRVGE